MQSSGINMVDTLDNDNNGVDVDDDDYNNDVDYVSDDYDNDNDVVRTERFYGLIREKRLKQEIKVPGLEK